MLWAAEIGRARREMAEGDLSAGAETLSWVLRQSADVLDAHLLLADIRERQRYFPAAAQHLLQAERLDPANSDLPWRAGRLHLSNFTPEDGVAPLLRAVELKPDSVPINVDVARAYVAIGAPQLAVPYLERARDLAPDDPMVETHLGSVAGDLGRTEEAARAFQRVLELGGDRPYALFRLALLTRSGHADPELGQAIDSELEQAREVSGHDRTSMLLHQGAARLAAATGDATTSWQQLLESKRVMNFRFDRDQQRHLAEQTRRIFTSEFLAERADWGDISEVPVFIIGMPRSGSTLVETVLDGHPGIESLGERNSIDVIAHELWYGNGEPGEYEQRIRGLDRQAVADLAAQYLHRTRVLAPRGRHTVNKMLHNYRHVGLIRLLFPRARFLHTSRHPLDTCWSIFTNPIEHGHPYAQSLDDLGWQYDQYAEMIQFWRDTQPGLIHDVVYEDFVRDLEGQSRTVLDVLGLPWHSGCLDFAHRERAVQTMSAQQVRTDVYTSSIGRWRQHVARLRPLIDVLVEGGIVDAAEVRAAEVDAD